MDGRRPRDRRRLTKYFRDLRQNLAKCTSSDITVVDRSDQMYVGATYQFMLNGRVERPEEIALPYKKARLPRFVNTRFRNDIVGIDFDERVVTIKDNDSKKTETLEYDILVLAMGVSFDPSPVNGLSRALELNAFHNLCSLEDTMRLRKRVEALRAGHRVLCVVTNMPYKCPPAPFEIVFLIDEMLRERGLRRAVGKTCDEDASDVVHITLAFPKPFPFAGPFPHVHKPYLETCKRRSIRLLKNHKVVKIDVSPSKQSTVEFAVLGDDAPSSKIVETCDVLLGTLPQRAPDVLQEVASKRTKGFIPADIRTCELIEKRSGHVYVVGDCAHFTLRLVKTLKDGSKKELKKPHPKSGHFAYQQGLVVAKQIDALVRQGRSVEDARKAVANEARMGQCYAEIGYGEAIGMKAVLRPADGSDPYFESYPPSRPNGVKKCQWIRGHVNRMFEGIDTLFLDESPASRGSTCGCVCV